MLHHENQSKNKKSMQSLPENVLPAIAVSFFCEINCKKNYLPTSEQLSSSFISKLDNHI
jgi:hypothetical protein